MTDEQTTTTTTTETQPTETAKDIVGSGTPEWARDYQEETRTWIAAKGIKDPEALAKSYRELESKFGADRAERTLVLPENGDAEAWGSVYNALGRPESPDGYELVTAEGADPEFTKGIGEALFNAGVSVDNAKALASKVEELAKAAQDYDNQQWEKTSANELDQWKREQGVNVTKSIEAANSAAMQFDLSQDDISNIERAIGTGRTMTLLQKIGEGLGEDTLPKEASRAKLSDVQGEIDRMKADPDIRRKIRENDYATRQRWDALHAQLRQIKGNPYTG